ncbi:MAG: hypothetical protein MZU95_16785 [Desulfomicrobium escambiense]|nr:hypothetical protein [Desulfomicrobium escambiense]
MVDLPVRGDREKAGDGHVRVDRNRDVLLLPIESVKRMSETSLMLTTTTPRTSRSSREL